MKTASWLVVAGLLTLAGVVLCWPITEHSTELASGSSPPVNRLDLSTYSSASNWQNMDLLFIHHSCGGQLLATSGPEEGANSIYRSHPNGGNLRALLEQSGYLVHEASYGCRIGADTDIFDWPPKFRSEMSAILRCANQDQLLPTNRLNRIVLFKSCFPNSQFLLEGDPPGNPAGPKLTVWNARAAYASLLQEFQKQPDTLFICLTAPPLAPNKTPMRLWRWLARKIRGGDYELNESGRLSRQFNNWLCDTGGWLKDYPLRNVAVFDYYDILTGFGRSNLSIYATEQGFDSHPSHEGNAKSAIAFVPFLNRAVHRAQLTPATP